jgi:DNA replication protein DnaC
MKKPTSKSLRQPLLPEDPATRPADWTCPECGQINTSFWIPFANLGGPKWSTVQAHCDRCRGRKAQQEDFLAAREKQRQQYLEEFGFSDSRSEYARMTFDNYIPDPNYISQASAKALAMRVCAGWPAEGYMTGMVFYSPRVGVGKTHLAVAMARFAIDDLRTVGIWSMPEYLQSLKNSYERKEGAADLQERVQSADVLVLDDLGAENVSKDGVGWYQDLLFNIFNLRWREHKATIITTNLSELALAAKVGRRVSSRLTELIGGQYIEIDGEDYRQKKGRK